MTRFFERRSTVRREGAVAVTHAPGSQLGRYTVEDAIAVSAHSVVYRVRHQTLPRAAALKLLATASASERERLLRMARVASSYRGLACADVFDVAELADGRPYVVMEWLEGETLATAVTARGSFTLADTLAVVEDLGDLLSAAHRDGIAHGSLHAGHVMTTGGVGLRAVKLLNLGAELAPPAADLVQLGALVAHLVGADRGAPIPAALRRAIASCRAGAHQTIDAALRGLRAALSEDRAARPRWLSAVGVHVELRVDSADAEDLVALADALAVARATLVAGELEVAIERPNALLAVRAVDDDEEGARARVLDTARLVIDRLSAEPLPGVQLRIAMHEANLLVRRRGERVDYVGGDLLCLGKWPKSAVL